MRAPLYIYGSVQLRVSFVLFYSYGILQTPPHGGRMARIFARFRTNKLVRNNNVVVCSDREFRRQKSAEGLVSISNSRKRADFAACNFADLTVALILWSWLAMYKFHSSPCITPELITGCTGKNLGTKVLSYEMCATAARALGARMQDRKSVV